MKTTKKDLKAHHHLAIVSMLCFGVVSVWAWGTIVFAAGSQLNVHIGPPDACSNITGYQSAVPDGMNVDASGNCATPTPPPQDVCDNMPGVQTAIPAGYYREVSGDCLPQTTPPQDVCDNLSGIQVSVPKGYLSAPDGNCEPKPLDVCTNIDGPQFPVPDGMERQADGTCFTPVPATPVAPVAPTPSEPTETPTSSGAGHSLYMYTDLKNVPGPLESVLMPIVNAIPENVKDVLRATPPIIARSFPYAVFAVLGVASTIIAVQALLEAQASRRLAALLRREKDIAEEKDSFIALASHYLRTPLTLMSGSVSTIVATEEVAPETVMPLQTALGSLESKISTILADIEANTALQSIHAPAKDAVQPSFLRSAFFWTPIVTTVIIALLSNFLLGVVGNIELGITNLWAQVLVLVAVSGVFYVAIRNRYIKIHERGYRESLIAHENAIDEARNEFIERALLTLRSGLEVIAGQKASIEGTRSSRYFNEGMQRFENMLKKFSLLSQIQTGIVGVEEKFDLKSAIDLLIESYRPELDARSITVVNRIASTTIIQRRSLFDFVFGSLIDNAIKFSNEGGTIHIDSSPRENSLVVKVADYGPAIPAEKMSRLFKPFSRGTSTMEFNYEGLGFSLFLDKIIMDYVGGEISATSGIDDRTTFTVKTRTA